MKRYFDKLNQLLSTTYNKNSTEAPDGIFLKKIAKNKN